MKVHGSKLTREQRRILDPYGVVDGNWLLVGLSHGKKTIGGGYRRRTDEYTLRNVNTGEQKIIPIQLEY